MPSLFANANFATPSGGVIHGEVFDAEGDWGAYIEAGWVTPYPDDDELVDAFGMGRVSPGELGAAEPVS